VGGFFIFAGMSSIIFFDDFRREQLLPLTFTRPVAELRIGITTIKEKWQLWWSEATSFLTENYLQDKFPAAYANNNLYLNAGIIPHDSLTEAISKLRSGEALINKGEIIAVKTSDQFESRTAFTDAINKFRIVEYRGDYLSILRPWHLFQFNDAVLRDDFRLLTAHKKSAQLSATNTIIGDNIFIGEGALAEASVFNTTTGPVYIDRNAEIMEGCLLRGPVALCEHSTLKMGAKIYGATTIGPHSKAGGEINNGIITGYSNKAHDGFLGNSVIGEWCNLGADTNTSNLKNNYTEVKVWDYVTHKFISTGLQFCGLIMGDHSKCGINTMFNTGTVVGVNANIFGSGFPRNYIPSFSWGGAAGFTTYKLNDALSVAEEVMKRRNIIISSRDKNIIEKVYEMEWGTANNQLIAG
jgi:UDP-N-acetylglucosamine diphosphorylase/glucosamine-1-phosphate N-acetyltransferase